MNDKLANNTFFFIFYIGAQTLISHHCNYISQLQTALQAQIKRLDTLLDK